MSIENSNEIIESKDTSIKTKLGLIASWFFGIILIMAGAGMLIESTIAGLLVFVAGLLLIPTINNVIKEKVNINLSGSVRAVIAFTLFIVGAAILPPTENNLNNTFQNQVSDNQNPVSNYKWQTEQGTLLRKAEEVVIDQIGEKNNMGENTVISIQTERNGLWINYHASENFTSNMTRGGIKSEMVDVFSNLDNQILEGFDNVTIVAELPLINPEGHESVVNVMRVSLTTAKIREINWNNFLRENLEIVAFGYDVHPAIQ